MGQVLHVDFQKKSLLTEQQAYILSLAEQLDEFDFWDLVDAIENPAIYQIVDEDIQILVDKFYQLAG